MEHQLAICFEAVITGNVDGISHNLEAGWAWMTCLDLYDVRLCWHPFTTQFASGMRIKFISSIKVGMLCPWDSWWPFVSGWSESLDLKLSSSEVGLNGMKLQSHWGQGCLWATFSSEDSMSHMWSLRESLYQGYDYCTECSWGRIWLVEQKIQVTEAIMQS